jgi:type I restriction enzyme S subunit
MEKLIPKLRFPEFKGEWEKKKLGDVAENISSGKSKTKEICGSYPLYGSTGLIGYSKINDYSGEKILIARVGANAGSLYKVEGEYSVSDNTLMLDLSNEIDVNFIYSNLIKSNLNKLVFGSGQPLITGGQLKSFEIYLPNFSEQQKIATFLTSVDEKLQALKKKKSLLEQYKKGVMQKIFSQELRFKDENGNDFPEWEEKSLGEVAEKRIVKNKDNNINLVFTNSAQQGIVNQRDYFDKDIANQNNLTGYYIVEKDDFVYNPRISNYAPVGPISRNHLDTGIMSPLYSVFRFKMGNLDFIEMFFNSTIWYEHMENISNYGARDDRMSFSSSDFYKMPVPFPSIEEQTLIANFLSVIDDKINHCGEQIAKMEVWKKGLLQGMFC